MKIRIRRAGKKDAKVIGGLAAEFETYLGGIEGKQKRVSPARIAADLVAVGLGDRKYVDAVLAERDGKAVGYALFSRGLHGDSRKAQFHVVDIFVTKSTRDENIGRDIMLHLRQLAKAEGCQRLVWNVWSRNPGALKFYLSLGAKPLEEENILLSWRV